MMQIKKTAVGPFVKCPHPQMIEAISYAGFDFAVIDMEHTPIDNKDLYILKLAAEARNLDLIVRVPANSEEYIKWCLDLNYKYLQIPFIQTKQDAEKAVKLAYFSPKGERGLCKFVRANQFSAGDKNEYIKDNMTSTNLILQIEGAEGVNNIESILEVKDIFSIFIGPYDLSQSLGFPGDIWNPKVLEKIEFISKICQKKSIQLGIFTDTPEGLKKWSNLGFNYIEYSSDLNLFMNGACDLLSSQV